ncbi:hypothetical protein AJ79_06138 [Helicocarpus griseus UAMH5409]|uniref:Cyanovirin-N domain-containing protein n=1 Tax=Helicocarpus griseus UAMH5409 TaxID=1447875 RepID=A0A2B7XG88_9EURO|nr:hypothetical protein AJ79_06138 [Helicocarpus griseus UAMH5409]
MKFAAITVACMALANSAVAVHCTQGLNYCGTTLTYIDFDFYRPKIGQLGQWNILQDFLYRCNANGEISLIQKCEGGACVNGGGGKNDYCNPNPRGGGIL